ncbi:hypothetical protein AB0I98_21025 [Streptomyces sp. NPDC050211]|uniref:hypothetical protein n=1 Tax=Streptomyces sp. NPDC050211 TaxID=3154932 RepID=UPI0034209632
MTLRAIAHRLGLPVALGERDARNVAKELMNRIQKDVAKLGEPQLAPDSARDLEDRWTEILAQTKGWHRPYLHPFRH